MTRARPLLLVVALTSSAASLRAETVATRDGDATRRIAALYGVAGGLTADEVAARAVLSSADVRGKALGVQAAQLDADRAAMGFLPRLDVRARYTRLSPITQASLVPPREGTLIVSANPDPGTVQALDPLFREVQDPVVLPVILNQASFDATLTIPVSDYALRLARVHDLGLAATRAATHEARASRAVAAASARIAYYQWAKLRGQVVVAEQGVEQAKSHLADAQHGYALGVAGKADAARAESQVSRAELLVAQAKNGARLAERRVRLLVRAETGARLEVGEDVLAPLAGSRDEPLAALETEALRRRPELAALDESASARRAAASVARVDALPRFDVIGGAQVANPNTRFIPQQRRFDATWEVSAVVTWRPTDLPGVSAAAAAEDARAGQLVERRVAVVDAIRLEVMEASQAVVEAREAIETTRRALTSAEESHRTRRELYRAGRASFVEIADAEADVTRARLESVAANVDARIARVRLAHAVGRDAPVAGEP